LTAVAATTIRSSGVAILTTSSTDAVIEVAICLTTKTIVESSSLVTGTSIIPGVTAAVPCFGT
jgi:hypothetical protein